MKIVGYIVIEEGLPLRANCLDEAFDIKIGCFNGKLLTPILSPDNSAEENGFHRNLLIEPESEINFIRSIEWGKQTGWPSGNSIVERLKLEIEKPSDAYIDEFKEDLLQQTNEWIFRFKENFFAYGYFLGTSSTEAEYRNKVSHNFDYYFKAPPKIR